MPLFKNIVFGLIFIAIITRLSCWGQGWKTWFKRNWGHILMIGVVLGIVLNIIDKLL